MQSSRRRGDLSPSACWPALAANGGLWSLLARQPSLAFFVHPQVWLIPAAASVLIAAQLNRDRLAAGQLRFVRYCCLMIVYVSSTADIFLNGVKDHPWLPLVLAGLSCRRNARHPVSAPRLSLPRHLVPGTLGHHDDLLCLGRSALDLALVRRGDRLGARSWSCSPYSRRNERRCLRWWMG